MFYYREVGRGGPERPYPIINRTVDSLINRPPHHTYSKYKKPEYWVAFVTNHPELKHDPGNNWNLSFETSELREIFINQIKNQIQQYNNDLPSNITDVLSRKNEG